MKHFFTRRWLGSLVVCWALTQTLPAQNFVNDCPVPPFVKGPVINFTVMDTLHNFSPSTSDDFDAAIPSRSYNSPQQVPARPGQATRMTHLGPTLIWEKNSPININVTNQLFEPTTTHWHGANLPALWDGGPQEVINSGGGTFTPAWTVRDSVTTHWYHSHMMDETTKQVAQGLAGFIIVQDTANDPFYNSVPHNYGYNDFPLVIQEKGFVVNLATNIVEDINYGQVEAGGHPSNQYYTPVNGILNPVLRVPTSMVRFRFLNGSLRKSYNFGMFKGRIDPFDSTANQFVGSNVYEMIQIASDGGYLENSYSRDSILFGPGERYEVVVDFSGLTSADTIFLVNLQRSINTTRIISTSGTGGGNHIPTEGFAFMAFVPDPTITPADPITSIPPLTFYPNDIDTSNIFRHRLKVLDNGFPGNNWTINGDTMNMDSINDIILVNTKEIWTISNNTTKYHPFHIHKTEFKVIDIVDTVGGLDTLFNAFAANPTMPDLMGDKDVVMVPPGCKLRFVAHFDSFPNTSIDIDSAFMYHCHILTHEDHSMMHQFVVVDSATYYGTSGTGGGHQHELFSLFPNPSDGNLWIKGHAADPGSITLTDAMGRQVWKQDYQPFHYMAPVNVSHLSHGLYFIDYKSASQHWTGKVVIE